MICSEITFLLRSTPFANWRSSHASCSIKKDILTNFETSQENSYFGVPLVSVFLPSKHLLVFKTSWRRLQHVFSVTILCLPRRFEDVFKTSPRQTKFLLVISVSNKSKCVSNKSMFHKSVSDKFKANQKCFT